MIGPAHLKFGAALRKPRLKGARAWLGFAKKAIRSNAGDLLAIAGFACVAEASSYISPALPWATLGVALLVAAAGARPQKGGK